MIKIKRTTIFRELFKKTSRLYIVKESVEIISDNKREKVMGLDGGSAVRKWRRKPLFVGNQDNAKLG